MTVRSSDQNPWQDVSNDRSVLKRQWTGGNSLANTDTTAPVGLPEYADRSWQVEGTFGAGGNVIVEGSNNGGVSWQQKHDLSGGNPIAFTAAGTEGSAERTELERARVTAGDGSTNIQVYLTVGRSNPRGH